MFIPDLIITTSVTTEAVVVAEAAADRAIMSFMICNTGLNPATTSVIHKINETSNFGYVVYQTVIAVGDTLTVPSKGDKWNILGSTTRGTSGDTITVSSNNTVDVIISTTTLN